MPLFTHHASRTLAALAMVLVPTLALAQTPPAAQPNPAAEHLSAARTALNKALNAPAPSGEAFKKLTELKTQYIALERAASKASPQWATHASAIDLLVTDLIGARAAESGAVGTSGPAGAAHLDPAIVANLQEFRTHLTAFSAAMSGVAPPPAPAAAPTTPPVTTSPATTTPPATVMPPATTTTPPATPPVSAPPPSTPTTEATAAPAPSSDAAILTQLDQVTSLVDGALASAQSAAATISIDRATLEQIKAQLEQIKQRMKKP